MRLTKHLWLLLFVGVFSKLSFAQQFIGMGTGNYGGVTSLTLNPSSIADSRHKFDINLFSISSYFDNNLVDIKRDAFYRGQFFKSPYNSDYAAVRRDLLSLQSLPANQRVNGLFETRIQAPLSAMVTTGKNSAIGITFQSRAGFQTYNMARNTAQLIYQELNNPQLHGSIENNSGFETNHLRWQEVGFTYARVLVNSGVHFLKAGVTGKWLMGQAGAYIQSDNLNVTFNSQTELSLQSPLIRYYRSDQADINQFNTNTFFRDIEDHGFGWDAGVTYEFRGNFDKFKIKGPDNTMLDRRDMNKYSLRFAAAIMDAGRLQFAKQALTNDHSANFVNWDFTGVRANNINDFDTAYATQVQYVANADENFAVAMPTALSANIDLRVHRGFYVNAAVYKPLRNFNNNTQSGMRPVEWFALTPRFETRALGIYVPITMTNLHERTDVGLTLRAGPLFIGSNNLGSYLFNEQLPSVDVHAGVKIGITYGKPTRLIKSIEKLRLSAIQKDTLRRRDSIIMVRTVDTLEARYKRTIDSLKAITDSVTLRNKIMSEFAKADSLKKAVPVEKSTPAVNIIINNYLPSNQQDTVRTYQSKLDTLVINNRLPVKGTSETVNVVNTASGRQVDSILQQKEREVEFLLRQNAEQSLILNELGILRKEDSVLLYQLQDDRKRMQAILSDSIEKWRLQMVPAQPVTPAPEERKRRSIFRRNTDRDETMIVQPQQQRDIAYQLPPDAVLYRDINTQNNKAEVRAIQRSNRDVEIEMQRLRRSMALNTAMVTQAMAANSAAMVSAARPPLNDNNVALVGIVPDANVQANTGNSTNDTLADTIRRETAMHAMVRKADTVYVRDTIFLPGAPLANRQIETNNPTIIRDTAFVEKPVSQNRIPDQASVFFASGSASLSLNAKTMLNKWSSLALNINSPYEVELLGSTDATGSETINRRVAQNRINTVSNYLTSQGISQQKIKTSISLAPKGSTGSNPANRRVDVKFVTSNPG